MIPGFPPYPVKRATWSGFEAELFEVKLAAFQEFFPVVKKVCYIKKEKNSLSDLSRNARKSFSANESFHFFSYIEDLKPVAVSYAFLYQIL